VTRSLTAAVTVIEADRSESVFLEDYIASRPPESVELHRRYFDSPICRQEAADREGLSLGSLLRTFNETAPLSPPVAYDFGGREFAVRSMDALCDDFHGPRFGPFGDPLTLRMYLTGTAGLPAEMFRLADWNFMDGRESFFVGYAYGSVCRGMVFLSGIQSDIAQRYTYLFQGNRGDTEVREGEGVVLRATDDLRDLYGSFVPVFRKVFQRRWIPALMAGVVAACRERGVSAVALQRFELTAEEERPGHIVHRIYEAIPGAVPGVAVGVRTDRGSYFYHRMKTLDLAGFVRSAR
jgi:hypothetical protein